MNVLCAVRSVQSNFLISCFSNSGIALCMCIWISFLCSVLSVFSACEQRYCKQAWMSVCTADIYYSFDFIQIIFGSEVVHLNVFWHADVWWLVNHQRNMSHSAKYSKSHEHVYCSVQGPLHEQLHVTPLPPPATVFLLELSVCTVCGALSVCFRQKCCCEGWWGKGITRLVFVQCTGLSSLAWTYTLMGKNRGLLWTPRPSWSVCYSNSLSPSPSQSLAFSHLPPCICPSRFLTSSHTFKHLIWLSYRFCHHVGLASTYFAHFRTSLSHTSVIQFLKTSSFFSIISYGHVVLLSSGIGTDMAKSLAI